MPGNEDEAGALVTPTLSGRTARIGSTNSGNPVQLSGSGSLGEGDVRLGLAILRAMSSHLVFGLMMALPPGLLDTL